MLAAEAGFHQHQNAKNRQRNPRQLFSLQAFTEGKGAENNGEERLRLKHQRGQAGGHPKINCAE
jgi:hypothetical protein